MKRVLLIVVMLAQRFALSYSQDTCAVQVRQLFEKNFKIIESSFPYDFANETRNISSSKDFITFTLLVSNLTGIGMESSLHTGKSYVTRKEFIAWKQWYEDNKTSLKPCEILDGFNILLHGLDNYEEEKTLIRYGILQYPEPILFKRPEN